MVSKKQKKKKKAYCKKVKTQGLQHVTPLQWLLPKVKHITAGEQPTCITHPYNSKIQDSYNLELKLKKMTN